METLIINIPDKKSALVKQVLKDMGVTIQLETKNLFQSSENAGKAVNDHSTPTPPTGKRISVDELLADFGAAPDFPSIEEIRTKAWPSKW